MFQAIQEFAAKCGAPKVTSILSAIRGIWRIGQGQPRGVSQDSFRGAQSPWHLAPRPRACSVLGSPALCTAESAQRNRCDRVPNLVNDKQADHFRPIAPSRRTSMLGGERFLSPCRPVSISIPVIHITRWSSGDCYKIGIRCRGTPAEQGTSVPSCGRESTPIIGS